MAARRSRNRDGLPARALAALYRASHTVPAVGFLVAALLGVGWWKLRGSASAAVQWAGLALGVLAIFFAVVALAGFVLILLERPRRSRSSRRT